MSRKARRNHIWLSVLVGLWLFCGRSPYGEPARQAITDRIGRTVYIPAHGPQRVVAMNPSIVEFMVFLGVADRLIGVSEFTDDIEQVAQLPRVGGPFTPNFEAIVALEPDLVILDRGHNPRDLAQFLDRQRISYFVLRSEHLDDIRINLVLMGRLFHRMHRVRRWQSRWHRLLTCLQRHPFTHPPRIFFLLSIRPIFSIGRGSFILELLRRIGFNVVTARIDQPWPQVNPEMVVAMDPDYIWIPENIAPAAQVEFTRNPMWSSLRAVRNRHIVSITQRILRPSPFLLDIALDLVRRFHPQSMAVHTCMTSAQEERAHETQSP